MSIVIAVDGVRFSVSIEARSPGEATATVDGKQRIVNIAWIDPDTVSIIDGSIAREVRFHHRREAGAAGVEIAGVIHEAKIDVSSRGSTPVGGVAITGALGATRATGATGAADVIASPMPGRVMRVLAAVGDRVSAGQPLVVVEAMKMENELRAQHEGTVTDVHAVEGSAVDAGAVLMIVVRD